MAWVTASSCLSEFSEQFCTAELHCDIHFLSFLQDAFTLDSALNAGFAHDLSALLAC